MRLLYRHKTYILSVAIILLLTGLFESLSFAQIRRQAAPPPQIEAPNDDPLGFVIGWQKDLAKRVTSPVSWVLILSPFWLPIFVLWIRRIVVARKKNRKEKEREQPPLPRLPELATPKLALPMQSSAAQSVFLDAKEGIALVERFAALGVSEEVLVVWQKLLQNELSPKIWQAWIDGNHGELRERLGTRWLKQLAFERIRLWLLEHPLIQGEQLDVEISSDLEVASINELGLISKTTGLGVNPDSAQQEVLRYAKRALTLAYRGADNPYTMEMLAKKADLPALLLGPDDSLDLPSTYHLSIALHGVNALRRAVKIKLISERGEDYAASLMQHRKQKKKEVKAESCVSHALLFLPDTEAKGIGVFLAAVAGAAFSPQTVALEISRHLTQLDNKAFEKLGRLCAESLAKPSSESGQLFVLQIKRMLGEKTLKDGLIEVQRIEHEISQHCQKAPIWSGVKISSSPLLSMFQAHKAKIEYTLNLVPFAEARLSQILAKVAYAGAAKRDQVLAASRLGYVLAGLGSQLFVGQSEKLIEASKAAINELYPGA